MIDWPLHHMFIGECVIILSKDVWQCNNQYYIVIVDNSGMLI